MNLKFLLVTLGVALIFGACSNDLELTTDWKDIPVVYGLLNKSDDTHYIRVEKAFLDKETSAFILAQEPDSLFYDNVSVVLEKTATGQQFELQRVDGNKEGLIKSDGIFATEPNYLYKIDGNELNLAGGETIRLILNRGDNLPEVTAQTVILDDMVLKSPNAAAPDPKFGFVYEFNEDVSFTAPDEAVIFDVRLLIHYQEFEKANPGPTLQDKTLEWIWDRSATREKEGDARIKVEVSGESFYTFLRDHLEENPELGRFFKGIDVVITAGGEELATFIQIKNANAGITSSQELPFYTNLSEGRGVFSSRNTLVVPEIDITPGTKDSLRHGIHTKDLNFL